uniref:SET domain-containing protein n=1 Tax=Plectus sambesii TaxID=2011161 RepID=A0A914W5U3_9BILA
MRFKRTTYLKRHALVHLPKSNWEHICPICAKVCAGRRDNFDRHMKSCAKKKPSLPEPPQAPIMERRQRRAVVAKSGVEILEGFLRLPLLVTKKADIAGIRQSLVHFGETKIETREVSEIVGRGVYALQSIKRGDAVCEYSGTLLTGKTANERITAGSVDESYTMFFSITSSAIGGYINHCRCGRRTNLVRKLIKDDTDLDQWLRIIFIASKDIAAGKELR